MKYARYEALKAHADVKAGTLSRQEMLDVLVGSAHYANLGQFISSREEWRDVYVAVRAIILAW